MKPFGGQMGTLIVATICALLTFTTAQATDYSSTNFYVRDPSLGGGGTSNATSTNFQVRSFFDGLGIGRGTSTNFQGESGFEYYTDTSTLTQSAYRFAGNLNSTDVDYTGAAAQDNAYTVSTTGQKFRLRLLLHNENGRMAAGDVTFKLQFGLKATTCAAVTFADVATGSGAIRYNDNASPADAAALTNNAGDPTHSGHTIVNQTYEESNNFTSTGAVEIGQDGKWDFALVNTSATGGQRYCFRAVKSDGTVLGTYSVYPEAIIDEELSFSLDSTTKNFGTITPDSAPTDLSSTLTTTTNAASGYQVTLWATQLLTRTGGGTIANWSGTNGTPTTFSGAGDSRFGYTTDDSSLSGGTADRFTNGGAKYAGFALTGPGDIVADETSTPVSAQVFTVGYRLRTDAAQTSGSYSSTLIYINTATY